MGKIYLVDSENVGDIWVPLLVSSQEDDEVLVFYTTKSPHMNYENVRMLKETEKEADFIKCFEGSNALDFQLVSELGYRLSQNADREYVIVSNDTGFDAAVRYWSTRKMPVSRLSGKECHRMLTEKKQRVAKESGAAVEPEQEQIRAAGSEVEAEQVRETGQEAEQVRENGPEAEAEQVRETGPEPEAERVRKTGPEPEAERGREQSKKPRSSKKSEPSKAGGKAGESGKPDLTEEQSGQMTAMMDLKEEMSENPQSVSNATDQSEAPAKFGLDLNAERAILKTLCACISKENLVDFHNALVALLGEEEGKRLYQELKTNAEYASYWSELPAYGLKEKFDMYCKMVFDHSEYAKEPPEDFSGFLYQANGKRKNLNSLRAALQGHYGKDKGMKYYSLFKSHIKMMNRM